MEIPSSCWKNQDGVSIYKLGEDTNRVLKTSLVANILASQVVTTYNLTRIPCSQCHTKVSELGVFEARERMFQSIEGMHRICSAFHFCFCQIKYVCTVNIFHVHEIQVGCFTSVRQRRPGTSHRDSLGNNPCVTGTLQLSIQIRGFETIFFPCSLLFPGVDPVLVCCRVLVNILEKLGFVDPCHIKHRGDSQHPFHFVLQIRHTCQVCNVSVPSAIDDTLRQNGLPAAFAFSDDTLDDPILCEHFHSSTVKKRPDATLSYEMVSDNLEKIGIKALRIVVRPLDSASHLGCDPLHFNTHSF
mmetsp:Transcript_3395/g.6428  ORF Transcript_3395/g.6428 Transcript_3395/m.6428 type:complete len:300 (-) Transcript_3395:433-1332(-)